MPDMKHLFLLLFLGLNLAACSSTGEDRFVYSGFNGANLTLDGVATVTPDGLLELTNGSSNHKGHAFHPTPMRFRKSSNGMVQSFSVTFVFGWRSQLQAGYNPGYATFGIISIYAGKSAQGMAFLISPSKNFSDALPAQYLGLLNDQNNGNSSNRIFAVELDTIQNDEFEDIDNNHVGIDINSLHSVHSSSAGFYEDKSETFKNLSLISREAMQVWVDYDGEAAQINVTLARLKVAKPIKPLLSVTYNLSMVITKQAYIGFTSATGAMNSRHCVLGWSFGMNSSAPSIDVTKLPKLPRVGSKGKPRAMEIFLPIACTSFILAAGIVICLLIRRRLRYAELQEDWEVEFRIHRFSYKDLFHATEGFKNKHLIGVGGHGRVYKGVLPKSKLGVAVKRVPHESRDGMKEFVTEVVNIGRLQHRNLVQLLGYSRRKGELCLVYDYMPNGSLDKYLYCEERPTLSWPQRFQIIKGVASGLLYLHEKWQKVVVHRDIKASNVLLDSEMNGRLGDFGLAILYDHGTNNAQTTQIVGTVGYLAPELARTGKASPLTDVFAFGTFLLEVTCGRRPVKQDPQGNRLMLVDWVLEHWQNGSLTEAVDTRLQGEYDVNEACLVLKLGLLCSHPFTNARPSMSQVMQHLDGNVPLPELTPSHLGFNVLSLMQNERLDHSIML